MTIIHVVIIGFVCLEAMNVVALYFFPDTKYANGMGVFKAWEKSKQDDDVHGLVKYLVNWVAGTKLIFLLLLVVILLTSDEKTRIYTAFAMAISIASFFWRLFPLVKNMDKEGQIDPKNYSRVLGVMIGVFILIFLIAGIVVLL